MSFLVWGILGLLSGLIARAIYPGRQGFSLIGTIALGIAGSFTGGFLGSVLFNTSMSVGVLTLPGLISAVLGSCLLIFLYKLAS